jgi:peptide/nickel transport system permease protein
MSAVVIAARGARIGATIRPLLRHRLALAGAIVVLCIVVIAIFCHQLAPYGANDVDVFHRLQGPTWKHPFGTDDLGRDVLSRVILAAPVSLEVGAIAVGISLFLGTTIGIVAGFYGRVVDSVLMRAMDTLFAFPAVLLAVAIVAVLGPGLAHSMIAIGVAYTPIFARIARGSVLVVRESVYVRAARSLGASDLRLLRLHVLPNILAPIIVQTSLSFAFAILSEAALSFLGLGVQPPQPSWGVMLSDAQDYIQQAPWMGIFPGIAIVITVMAFNFLGDGLRDALDPQQRTIIESRGEVGGA